SAWATDASGEGVAGDAARLPPGLERPHAITARTSAPHTTPSLAFVTVPDIIPSFVALRGYDQACFRTGRPVSHDLAHPGLGGIQQNHLHRWSPPEAIDHLFNKRVRQTQPAIMTLIAILELGKSDFREAAGPGGGLMALGTEIVWSPWKASLGFYDRTRVIDM